MQYRPNLSYQRTLKITQIRKIWRNGNPKSAKVTCKSLKIVLIVFWVWEFWLVSSELELKGENGTHSHKKRRFFYCCWPISGIHDFEKEVHRIEKMFFIFSKIFFLKSFLELNSFSQSFWTSLFLRKKLTISAKTAMTTRLATGKVPCGAEKITVSSLTHSFAE